MTGPEYVAALDRLGLTPELAGAFLDVNRATLWRWRASGPPAPVAKLLRVMIARKLTAARVDELMRKPPRPVKKPID